MKETIDFAPAFAMLTLHLDADEAVQVEAGAMIANCGVDLETKSGGKTFFESLGRMFGGENFFMNTWSGGSGGGWVSMGSGVPGDIKSMQILPKREMYIQGGCFLASTTNVQTDAKWQGLKGFVSGNGLFFLRATVDSGSPGKVWYSSYGGIKEIKLDGTKEVMVDTGHLVAFEDTVEYKVDKVGGIKSLFFGGEGLVMKLSGKGKIYIQSRQIMDLATMLGPFMDMAK